MANRARTEVNSRHFAPVRVIAQRIAEASVPIEHLGRKEAPIDKERVEADRRVALAHQEPVATRPMRLAMTEAHCVIIENRENLGAGEH